VYGNGEKTVLAEFRSADAQVTQLQDAIYFIDKTAPAEAAADDHWGWSVSISDNGMAFVSGAPESLEAMGAAFLSTRVEAATPELLGDWNAEVFSADTGEVSSLARFGSSVALSGDGSMIAVGAPYNTVSFDEAGIAFLFSRSGATLYGHKITSPSAVVVGHFGSSMSLSRNGAAALVGASGEWDTLSLLAGGRAHIFNNSSGIWGPGASLPAVHANNEDNFGFAVTLSGDGNTAAVGAYATDYSGMTNSGTVYIYTYSGSWTHTATITPPDPRQYGFFGYSVSLNDDGTRCAIGAYGETINGTSNRGAAYVFDLGSAWSMSKKIIDSSGSGAECDYFGTSVSLSSVTGDVLAVGSPNASGERSDHEGAVYVFRQNIIDETGEWGLATKFTARDGAFNDMLGYSVSCSADGEWIAAGAPGDDEDGLEDRGSVYIFHLE